MRNADSDMADIMEEARTSVLGVDTREDGDATWRELRGRERGVGRPGPDEGTARSGTGIWTGEGTDASWKLWNV